MKSWGIVFRNMIELKNVSKHFGGIKAVENVSLNIRPGSITGLIGPNGAGKTTLFNIIAGFYTPDFGDIKFEGNNISVACVQMSCFKEVYLEPFKLLMNSKI